MVHHSRADQEEHHDLIVQRLKKERVSLGPPGSPWLQWAKLDVNLDYDTEEIETEIGMEEEEELGSENDIELTNCDAQHQADIDPQGQREPELQQRGDMNDQ
ncbi:UNVERIFIED_CONTAM: hypothetical protein K2H54_042100 [Gekko kuhli]